MHLVFLNQYYPPDAAPTGVMLMAVAEECARQGHQVTVICVAGGYASKAETLKIETRKFEEKTARGVAEIRIAATRFGRGTVVGKLLDYASYYLGVAWRLGTISPPPDRIVALTTPPYLSVLARVFSKFRGADHAHWVMDLYPDVMVAHGMLAENGCVHRLLAGMARWGFGGRRCAAVLTLGPDMAEKCERAVGGPLSEMRKPGTRAQSATVTWVPLWGGNDALGGSKHGLRRDSAATALRRVRGWADDELVVMYSGNMGLGHRFGEILEVVKRGTPAIDSPLRGMDESRDESRGPLLPSSYSQLRTLNSQLLQKLRFVFYGGGKRRAEIEAFMAADPEAPVELHDYASAEELTTHLMSADVHLVSLEPAWTGTMVPSKLQGIFAAGRPAIFVGAGDSSIGKWVAESGGGWVVEADDVAGLRAALEEASDADVRRSRGEAAARFASECFDRVTNVKRVVGILAGNDGAGSIHSAGESKRENREWAPIDANENRFF